MQGNTRSSRMRFPKQIWLSKTHSNKRNHVAVLDKPTQPPIRNMWMTTTFILSKSRGDEVRRDFLRLLKYRSETDGPPPQLLISSILAL